MKIADRRGPEGGKEKHISRTLLTPKRKEGIQEKRTGGKLYKSNRKKKNMVPSQVTCSEKETDGFKGTGVSSSFSTP